MNEIIVKNLKVEGMAGVDHWGVKRPQILVMNIHCSVLESNSLGHDSIENTVNYSSICREVISAANGDHYFPNMNEMGLVVMNRLFEQYPSIVKIKIRMEKSKALLFALCVGIEMERSVTFSTIPFYMPDDFIFIKDLELQSIIGVNPCERVNKQKIIINLSLYAMQENCKVFEYQAVNDLVVEFVDKSSYKTIEAMANDLAQLLLKYCRKVMVRIEKPSALIFAETAGVQVMREKEPLKLEWSTVYIGIGTNIGNRLENINAALARLKLITTVKSTSFLYESEPKYVVDQPKFLNAVIVIDTNLEPLVLLKELKKIEAEMGRDFGVERNGPRIIDLDILLYGNQIHNSETLVIPHKQMHERLFVLLPLQEYYL